MQNPIAEAKAFAAEKPFKEALVRAHAMPADAVPDLTKATRLEVSADVVSMLAMKGVEWAVKLSRDTIDGVPVQEVKAEVKQTNTIELVKRIEHRLLRLGMPDVIDAEAKVVDVVSVGKDGER